jgi:hypothetical protein
MSRDARIRAMRWNERIRLVIGVFNRSAVAVLGAAAIGSAVGSQATAGTPAGFDLLEGVSLVSVGCAFTLHLLAHALVALLEPED